MDQQTIDTYNKMALEYDQETTNFWDRFPRTFIDRFASLVKERVLNIGCGPGRDALLFKEKGLDVICMDASDEMVKMCQSKGLYAVCGDFNALQFDTNSCGGVWAYTSLLHVPKKDVTRALKEIHRVLEKGAVCGLGLIEGDTEGYKESAGVSMPRWFSFYKKEEVESLMTSLGFELVYFETFKPRSKNYLNFIFRKI